MLPVPLATAELHLTQETLCAVRQMHVVGLALKTELTHCTVQLHLYTNQHQDLETSKHSRLYLFIFFFRSLKIAAESPGLVVP